MNGSGEDAVHTFGEDACYGKIMIEISLAR